MSRIVNRDATSLILTIRLADVADAPITGLAYNAAGLEVAWLNSASTSWTVVTLVAGTIGTYVANGWIAIGNGVYQIGLPNSAIAAGDRTMVRVTYSANPPQYDAIDAVMHPFTGDGNHLVTINVFNSETTFATSGAFISIRDADDIVVAYAVTGTSGSKIFGLDTGTYTALITASGYDSYELSLPVSGPDEFDAPLVLSETTEDVGNTTSSTYFRVDTAVDWEIPFVLGSLTAISWSKILFTAKTSPTEQDDSEAVLQIQLTSGGHVSDGLIVLNGAATTNTWASLAITDTATGAGVVTVKAIATTAVAPTNQDYWEITDEGLEAQRAWRTISPLEPPVIHFDIKRLDGSGRASPDRVEGLLVVSESVTQDVV